MSKTFKRLLMTGLICLSVNVAALNLLPDAPERYVVVKGDTLWDISERFTRDPWQWPEIWYQNEQIENPHLIFPGDVIGLIMVDGQTRIGIVSRGNASRTVKLSPGTVKVEPSIRVEPIESAIPAIPLDAIQGFITEHRVVGVEDLKDAPRIIAAHDGHILMGAGGKSYARGNFYGKNGSAYGIFRRGQVYQDPETEEILGLEAVDIGLGRVVAVADDVATIELDRTRQQVSIGDVLLPTEDRELRTQFFPKSPDARVSGKILAVSGGLTQVGQYDVVVLNRGDRDRMQPGDVLVIMKAGAVVYDKIKGDKVRLPAERAGSMMVFRTFDKMAYALVMRTTRPLRVGDEFQSP